MARGGINKALVRDACAALRGRGQYPSIDAVRVQLGNTGSKTTIARYLKELQPATAPTLPSIKERISAPILHVVDELTRQLEVETQQEMVQARAEQAEEQARHDSERQELLHDLQVQTERIAALQIQLTSTQAQLQQTLTELNHQNAQIQHSQTDNQGLLIRVEEKDAQIAQLTAQHAQTRLNLEHYREQGQTLREQLLRQHEHQLQVLNGELRHLQGQYTVSQEALVSLNRDNEGLIQQLMTQQQRVHQLDKKLRAVTANHDSLRAQQDQQQGINHLLSKQLSETQHSLQLRTLRCQHLETELASWIQLAKAKGWPLEAVPGPENIKPS